MRTHNPSNQRGSGLIIALILTAITGISMASYLSLVRNQNLSVMRSLYWNSALPVAESGVEEAMAHLNANMSNVAQEGWTLTGGRYRLSRTNGDSIYAVA